MYQTTNERLDNLEGKLDKIINQLSPTSAEPQGDNADVLAKIDDLRKDVLDSMLNTEDITKLLSLFNANPAKIDKFDEKESPNFERNMWYYAIIGFTASAVLTMITYKFALFFFPLAFSLFFAFSIVGLGLMHDKYLLPGNSIGRIANEATSASIFWLAFTLASVSGFAIGNSIISDPFGGEERGSKQVQERYIETTAPRPDSDTLRLGEGTTESEQ